MCVNTISEQQLSFIGQFYLLFEFLINKCTCRRHRLFITLSKALWHFKYILRKIYKRTVLQHSLWACARALHDHWSFCHIRFVREKRDWHLHAIEDKLIELNIVDQTLSDKIYCADKMYAAGRKATRRLIWEFKSTHIRVEDKRERGIRQRELGLLIINIFPEHMGDYWHVRIYTTLRWNVPAAIPVWIGKKTRLSWEIVFPRFSTDRVNAAVRSLVGFHAKKRGRKIN